MEIVEVDENSSILNGLFGPNPAVWTMFMFFHFLVAVLFIGFEAWTYSNWSLENPYGIQVGVMVLMIVLWFALYFVGRMGKKTGKSEMIELYHFMRDTLRIVSCYLQAPQKRNRAKKEQPTAQIAHLIFAYAKANSDSFTSYCS